MNQIPDINWGGELWARCSESFECFATTAICVSAGFSALLGLMVLNSYDHIPLLVSCLDIFVGFDDLLSWIAFVYHRFILSRLHKVFQ